jgi:predicted nucleotidyltransferase
MKGIDIMGQRLNIEIIEDGKVLANAYYHWSGFTRASLELTYIILEATKRINYNDRLVNAIKLLEVTKAGLTDEDREYAKKILKNLMNITLFRV